MSDQPDASDQSSDSSSDSDGYPISRSPDVDIFSERNTHNTAHSDVREKRSTPHSPSDDEARILARTCADKWCKTYEQKHDFIEMMIQHPFVKLNEYAKPIMFNWTNNDALVEFRRHAGRAVQSSTARDIVDKMYALCVQYVVCYTKSHVREGGFDAPQYIPCGNIDPLRMWYVKTWFEVKNAATTIPHEPSDQRECITPDAWCQKWVTSFATQYPTPWTYTAESLEMLLEFKAAMTMHHTAWAIGPAFGPHDTK